MFGFIFKQTNEIGIPIQSHLYIIRDSFSINCKNLFKNKCSVELLMLDILFDSFGSQRSVLALFSIWAHNEKDVTLLGRM